MPTPTIESVNFKTKSGTVFMPLMTAADLPGSTPAYGVESTRPLAPNDQAYPFTDPDYWCCKSYAFTQPASSSGSFTWQSQLGATVTGSGSSSITPTGDNGDGTWECNTTFSLSPSSGSVTEMHMTTSWGGNVAIGPVAVPYLYPLGGFTAEGVDGSGANWSGIIITSGSMPGATAPGFLYWNSVEQFANWVIAADILRMDLTPNSGGVSYATQPAAYTGEVDYVFYTWQVAVGGLTPGDSYSIFLHFDGDDFGTGDWATDEYQIEVDFIADSENQTIETWGLPVAIGTQRTGAVPPASSGFTRLNRVDFTSSIIPPPCCCCCCCCCCC
jgi:hypothetical protein